MNARDILIDKINRLVRDCEKSNEMALAGCLCVVAGAAYTENESDLLTHMKPFVKNKVTIVKREAKIVSFFTKPIPE